MNTCGTCKYFGKALESQWDDDNPEADKEGMVHAKHHVCDWMQHNAAFSLRFPAVAFVEDGSGYRATLCVSEEFGCNQWSAKSVVSP